MLKQFIRIKGSSKPESLSVITSKTPPLSCHVKLFSTPQLTLNGPIFDGCCYHCNEQTQFQLRINSSFSKSMMKKSPLKVLRKKMKMIWFPYFLKEFLIKENSNFTLRLLTLYKKYDNHILPDRQHSRKDDANPFWIIGWKRLLRIHFGI